MVRTGNGRMTTSGVITIPMPNNPCNNEGVSYHIRDKDNCPY